MKPTGRLQIYPPGGPQQTGYIVADRTALRGLAEAAKIASSNVLGFETVTLYSADGHEYELVITSDVTDAEWQEIGANYDTKSSMPRVDTLEHYQELKRQLDGNKKPGLI
jgi:hypothetical protein